MNSKHLALAAISIAAPLHAAEEHPRETTLYGSIGYTTWVSNSDKKTDTNLHTHIAYIGIRGREELAPGLAAIYTFRLDHALPKKEGDPDGLNRTRHAWVGLEGDFGRLTFGKHDSLWYDEANHASVFQDLFDYGWAGMAGSGKMIMYKKENIADSGITVAASAVLDGSHTAFPEGRGRAVMAAEYMLGYQKGGFNTVALYQRTSGDTMVTNDGGKTSEVMGISGTYRNDHYYLGADYEHHASKGDHCVLGGILYMPRRKHHLYAGVEMLDYDGQKNWYQGALGYTYYLSPRTYTWLEGQRWTQGKDKGYDIALGIRHNF